MIKSFETSEAGDNILYIVRDNNFHYDWDDSSEYYYGTVVKVVDEHIRLILWKDHVEAISYDNRIIFEEIIDKMHFYNNEKDLLAIKLKYSK